MDESLCNVDGVAYLRTKLLTLTKSILRTFLFLLKTFPAGFFYFR